MKVKTMQNKKKIGILTVACLFSVGIVTYSLWKHTVNSNEKDSVTKEEQTYQTEVSTAPSPEPIFHKYQIDVPDSWREKKMEDVPLTQYYENKKKVASIEEFKESWYATSIHSIVTNLYGMHANLSKEEEIRQENGFTLVKVIVDYEPSPAQQKKGTKAWQEQHYLFMNGTDTFFDLWVNTEELSEETINNLIDTFHIS